MPSAKKTPELLSIGELAQATGISPDTIRVWERRYGVPKAVRLPSGHRRYTPEQLRWLRRVVEAVALGERPGIVVHKTEEELQDILDARTGTLEPPADLRDWLTLLRRFDSDELTRLLRSAWERQGASDFLLHTVTPLLHSVGRAWSDGEIEVRHEHFFSELLHDLLRSLRLSIGVPSTGPEVLLASLSQDMHDLPVQMGALLCASKGIRVRVLGRDTPLEEVVRAAIEMQVDGVAIPTSLPQSTAEHEGRIEELRNALPPSIELCVGWHDARFPRRPRKGVKIVRELGEFELWLRELI